VSRIVAFFGRVWAAVIFLPKRIAALWPFRKRKVFRSDRVEEFPDKLDAWKVYLAGEGDNLWAAAMICPCGCGDVIELNLLPQARPRWTAQEHLDGTVSLEPSVWRRKGCRSHFVVRHGRIDWY